MGIRALGGVISPINTPLSNLRTSPSSTEARQYQGVFTLQGQGQAAPSLQWVQDPNGSSTVLALQPNGVASGTGNNTITDSATNCVITRTGNVTQGSFTPYSCQDGAWSNYFDGNDYLQVTGNSNLAFGTNDFTIVCFFTCGAIGAGIFSAIYDGRNDSVAQAAPTIGVNSSYTIEYVVNGAVRILSNRIQINTLYHLVVSRVSGNTRMFLNGVQVGVTYADSTNYITYANRPFIGTQAYGSPAYYWQGYISNLRVLNGTGTTAPTVPAAPLTAVPNTQLLTCQSNRIVDDSANGFAIANLSDVKVSTFSPFPTQNAYTPQTYGGSMFFDGVNDYLTFPDSAALELGTNNFCFECFFYSTTVTGTGMILTKRATSGAAAPIIIWRSSSAIQVYLSSTTTGSIINGVSMGSIIANKWNYLALCRNGTSIYAWLNGTVTALGTSSASVLNNADPYLIGIDGGLTTNMFSGYISNVRFTIGAAVYGNVTAAQPRTILEPYAGGFTQLLTAQGSTTDSSGNGVVVTASGSVQSTVSPFYVPLNNTGFAPPPCGSLYFDGATTGDYLTVATTPATVLTIGTNEFLIEAWVYTSGTYTDNNFIYDARPSGTATGVYPTLFVAATTGLLTYYVNGATRITSNAKLTTGQWYWVAVSRASGVTRMFINGVEQTGTYTDANNYLNGASRPIIGAAGDNVAAGLFTGYINNLRVAVGSGTGFTSATINNLLSFQGSMFTNTKLLLNANSGGIADSTSSVNLETSGQAAASTNAIKYGAESMYFDGTGDWLIAPVTTKIANPDNLQLGVGDFTIEAWVNIQSLAAVRSIASKGAAATGWTVDVSTTGLLQFSQTAVAAVAGKTPILLGTWTHVAVVRSGMGADNIRMYVNGILDYVSVAAVTTNFNQTESFYVGASRVGGTPMLGYMSDVRVSRTAKYLNNFVPPRSTLPRH